MTFIFIGEKLYFLEIHIYVTINLFCVFKSKTRARMHAHTHIYGISLHIATIFQSIFASRMTLV